jgi:Fur family ferric uptake transcriptional regulator
MRLTMPRQAILAALRDTDEWVSADEVFVVVRDQYPGIGIATVYRTLQLLAEIGVAVRDESGDGKARYKFATPEHTMRRVVASCRRCGTAISVPPGEQPATDLLARFEESLADQEGFSVEQSSVQFVGVCKSCREAAETPRGAQ